MSTFIKNKTFSHKASVLNHSPIKVEYLRQGYNFINSYFRNKLYNHFHKVCNFKGEILLLYLIKFESWNLVVIKITSWWWWAHVLLGSWVWLCVVMTQGTREISKSFRNRSMIKASEHTMNLGIIKCIISRKEKE